jgi:signal transduction histidine kinase
MVHRQISPFRPRRSRIKAVGRGTADRQAWLGLAVAGFSALLACAILFLSVKLWTRTYVDRENAKLEARSYSDVQTFLNTLEFNESWSVPPLGSGDSPAIRAFLAEQPFATWLVDRTGSGRVWMRSGDRLCPMPSSAQRDQVQRWAMLASLAGAPQWLPPAELDPDRDRVATQVFVNGDWVRIDRIVPGTPAMESFFRRHLGEAFPLRLGIFSRDMLGGHGEPEAWGAEPRLLIDYARARRSPCYFTILSTAFPRTWRVQLLPQDEEVEAILRGLWLRRIAGIATTTLVLGSFILGLWLRHRAFRKARLESDRLAALAHSLKTPLTIHKLRCDAIRLRMIAEEDIPGELISLGAEVDQFTRIIEQGLACMREQPPAPTSEVPSEWFENLADDFSNLFERAQRPLRLALTSRSARAAEPSLRSGLQILLENALCHGAGEVTLETSCHRSRFQITVRDEGAGLDDLQIKAIGRPFMRVRRPGSQGFPVRGNGLGLSLLVQMARNEGWGFTLASTPGKGLAATLVVQAAQPG